MSARCCSFCGELRPEEFEVIAAKAGYPQVAATMHFPVVAKAYPGAASGDGNHLAASATTMGTGPAAGPLAGAASCRGPLLVKSAPQASPFPGGVSGPPPGSTAIGPATPVTPTTAATPTPMVPPPTAPV